MKPSPREPYDYERLGRLLSLLRPAPQAWVARAKRIPFEQPAITDGDVAELVQRLESDPVFRKSFDADPVAATKAAGMVALAGGLERELEELVALAERITLAEDPQTQLREAGFPEEAAEPFLRALGAPDDVLAKLPEVVAHRVENVRVRTRLLIVLLETHVISDILGRGDRRRTTP